YRILTDILADIDEMYDKKAFHDRKAVKNGDTKQMKWMINGLTDAEDYEKRLIENCIYVLSPPDRNAKRIDFKDAVKCAVALDKRQFAMEVLPAVMLDLTISKQKEKPKRRWFIR
ncbi:MAG: hypothetical protein IKI68_04165, partial [Clostridia bacterium]|nr:hypothetical protein [Clostridia bacterium]